MKEASVYVYCITRRCGCFDFVESANRPFNKDELDKLYALPCPKCNKPQQAKET